MLKIATWNVNSLRVRLPQVLDWLAQQKPDILALQETKMTDTQFPYAEIEAAGYHVVFNGQPTYNGVALLSRKEISDVIKDIPGLADPQRRILVATIGQLRVINLYVPNGQSIDSDKYQYKLNWLQTVTQFLQKEISVQEQLIVLGDFNIAPEDIDVYDPKAWEGNVLVSQAERSALLQMQSLGLSDLFRKIHPNAVGYTWWDYRAAGFRRNLGMRLDLMLVTQPLVARCTQCGVDAVLRALERPSDHALLFAEFQEK